MTHGINAHETASYTVQTGASRGRDVYPSVGACLAVQRIRRRLQRLLPPYIVLTEEQGRFPDAAFWLRYMPFATGGDPRRLASPWKESPPGISEQRQKAAASCSTSWKRWGAPARRSAVAASAQAEDQAYELILATPARSSISRRKRRDAERYGRNTFGQSCL